MVLDPNQMGYFIQQVGLSAASFGVADADVKAAGTALNKLFNHRCEPKETVVPAQGPAFQSICIDKSCPLADNATCAAQPTPPEPSKASGMGNGGNMGKGKGKGCSMSGSMSGSMGMTAPGSMSTGMGGGMGGMNGGGSMTGTGSGPMGSMTGSMSSVPPVVTGNAAAQNVPALGSVMGVLGMLFAL